VNELVSVHRVIAIVGPMDAAVAQAAGARAQELGVPLIALTPAGTLPELGEMVFRYFPTPRSEARALAAALKARGAASYAVLYPQTAFGETMLTAFQQEAGALGLVQGTLRSYPAGATSFGAEASALAKERFDALFVPDAAQPLALIAPALAAAGMWSTPRDQRAPKNGRAILIAAPSVAYDPNLPRLAGRYLQGALFSVPFDAASTAAPVADFVARYQEAFGSNPDVFAAFAHDAYKLVRAAVDQGANTRELVASRLTTARDPSLVTPSAGFSAKREATSPTQVQELKADTFTK
jgi:ABC-type branched-subunit amino acid transport system substrate-binding protein